MNIVPVEEAKPRFVDLLRHDLERGTGDLPVLPRAADAALRLAQSPNFDYDDVVQVAESDPPLAARFLGVANSALYYRGVTIRSVKAALVRLGTQATRDVLYMAVYSGTVFKVPLYRKLVEETFKHSVVTARSARRIAEICGEDTESAFLAGLLHDVGRARCLKLASRRRRDLPTEAEVLAAVDELHAEAGAALAQSWNLPEEVVEACAYHHDPGEHPMALCVTAADQLAHLSNGDSEATEEQVVAALERVGIDEEQCHHLVDLAREDALLVRRGGN